MGGHRYVLAMRMELVSVLIVHLAAMEFATMIDWMLASLRCRAVVAVAVVKVMINMTVETARTMKPRACTDKDSASKPLGPVVTIRSAGIGRCFVITVRANRRFADLNGNLGVRLRAGNKEQSSSSKGQ